MKRIALAFSVCTALISGGCQTPVPQTDKVAESAKELKLSEYRPVSLFKVPQSDIRKAKYPVIDMHSHAYAKSPEQVQEWVREMDANNIEKTIILTCAYGEWFDTLYDLYTGVSDRFELWCGIDMSSWGTPDFPAKAIEELERCWRKGAKGVGELVDKGLGERRSTNIKEPGLHFNDDEFVPIFSRCAALGMPVSCHLGDPVWMYEELDKHNDGYMNAVDWKIDMTRPGRIGLYDLVTSIEEACVKNPHTTFIACHFINICHDYEYLCEVLDRHPNLYIDNAARHLESCATPRATGKFYDRYSERILFGTDNTPSSHMYGLQWRILESEDEHFYAENSTYHWPLHGIGLSNDVLKKIYRDNAIMLYRRLDNR